VLPTANRVIWELAEVSSEHVLNLRKEIPVDINLDAFKTMANLATTYRS
jgi:hypothetical protein